MNYLRVVLVMIFTLGIFTQVTAQPYTLDEEIKPIQLQLKEDKKRKGAQGLAANVTIDKEPQHFYVKGLDMFQFVDVFIFSNLGNPNFKVELVKNTWNEVEESATTGASDKGIINFKLRTYGDFGLKVLPSGKKVNYTIVVYASPPIEEHLGSAFTKSTDSEETEDASEEGSNKSSGSSNTLLYVIIGIALLVIGFLGAKLMSRKKATLILLLLSLGIFSAQNALAQGEIDLDPGVEEVDIDDIRSAEYREWLEERFDSAGDDIDEGLERLGEVGDMIEDDERYRMVRDLYDSYTGLGDCISSVPPPGMPRVPSFCETDDCGSCFVNARATFNQNRYSFERLKVIYNCTKKFTDAALSFGDNVSGVHGVSGLAWQSERRKIEKSIKDLEKAYDDKYVELLESQRQALMELNNCEAQHGIPDWYDRFGYMYYEFTAMHYKRGD